MSTSGADANGQTATGASAAAAPAKKDLSPAELLQQKLFAMLGGAMTSSLIALGDTLGLYKKMKELGQLSSGALADACGLSERFVREWLHQQVDALLPALRSRLSFELPASCGRLLCCAVCHVADQQNGCG